MTGVTLDAGALIGIERADDRVRALLSEALRRGHDLRVPAGAVAQVWRDPARQVRLSRLIGSREVQVVPLDGVRAKAAGLLCAATGTSDVVDASVAGCAREHGDVVVTSDPDDMARLVGRGHVVTV